MISTNDMNDMNDMNDIGGERQTSSTPARWSEGRALAGSLLLWAGLSPALPVQAQPSASPTIPTATASAAAMTDGEVRKVDREGGKLTLRHGPIASLDMQAMTMVFRVAQPQMLDAWKDGDRVRFTAERVGGALTVTHIERAD